MTTSLAPRRRTAADQQPPAGFIVAVTRALAGMVRLQESGANA